MRGNPSFALSAFICAWSIPACAGEPGDEAWQREACEVYPRVCGGTIEKESARVQAEGLSPRVRGNLRAYINHGMWKGSIPACAGEPRGIYYEVRSGEVYPRVCGGTRVSHSTSPHRRGLSPRVRGNLYGHPRGNMVTGSIPACAGEPTSCCPPCTYRRVYPRVCGGTTVYAAKNGGVAGLSPRVRGNLRKKGGHLRPVGSIPACAGEPKASASSLSIQQVYPRVCGGTRFAAH